MSEGSRFVPFERLSDEQKRDRFHRYHALNLPASKTRPIIRERFVPVLKNAGFRRASEGRFYRFVAPHYFHFVTVGFSSKAPGRFWSRVGVAVDIQPPLTRVGFDPRRANPDTDCLFLRALSFENGLEEFDNGTNVLEGSETVDHLCAAFRRSEDQFLASFKSFPEPIASLGPAEIQVMSEHVTNAIPHPFGIWGATIQLLVLRLATVQKEIGNRARARDLLVFGLESLQVLGLRGAYEELLAEVSAA